jgi:hypothetical protein
VAARSASDLRTATRTNSGSSSSNSQSFVDILGALGFGAAAHAHQRPHTVQATCAQQPAAAAQQWFEIWGTPSSV